MTTTDTNTLLYYKPYHGSAELMTAKDQERCEKLYGKRSYHTFESLVEDGNYGTGLHIVTEIMATIQCDRLLNSREEAIRERIAKGLTRSKGFNSQYGSMSEFVEQNLVFDLIYSAYNLFVRQGGDLKVASGQDSKGRAIQADVYNRPNKEFFRLFNLPYPSLKDKMDKDEAKIGDIPKPTKLYKIKFDDGPEYANDQDSVYKCHTIKAMLSYGFKPKDVYSKFPYLGKLHQSMFGTDNLQVYVYDYADRDWALQNVIHYLKTKGVITLM